MTLTFLQGQAIYQMLHILVSITQPIVERGYFSRFIWPSRGGRLFLLNAPSAEHNWALLSAQTRLCLTATHGNREEVRMQVSEQMSCGCYHTTVFLNFFFPRLLASSFLQIFSSGKHSLSFYMLVPSSIWSFTMMKSLPSLCLFICLPRHPSLSDFLDLFVPFSASHPFPPHLSSLSVVEWW